ncbi:MAG: anaerobic ribonucleoside-triphosphate reductase activating protein [Firmicutes bacterium]|nr:anaerobic ribonucleoside-triphosphate reductase activating protein [Bacillota bacterium]
MSLIRVASIVKESVVDGPGFRTVVFMQGCPRECPGCHNPEQIPAEGGEEITVDEVVRRVESGLTKLTKGITFSGGDPFFQPAALYDVIKLLKKRNPQLDMWVYTGYWYEEIKELPVLELIDVLVDGPYVETLRDISLPFMGSSNQRLIDVPSTRKAGQIIDFNVSKKLNFSR